MLCKQQCPLKFFACLSSVGFDINLRWMSLQRKFDPRTGVCESLSQSENSATLAPFLHQTFQTSKVAGNSLDQGIVRSEFASTSIVDCFGPLWFHTNPIVTLFSRQVLHVKPLQCGTWETSTLHRHFDLIKNAKLRVCSRSTRDLSVYRHAHQVHLIQRVPVRFMAQTSSALHSFYAPECTHKHAHKHMFAVHIQ